MRRPGVNTELLEAAPSRAVPTDTAPWFAAGILKRGPVGVPIPVVSMNDVVDDTGERESYSALLYDSLEGYFRTGGSKAYLSRAVGPAAAASSITLGDGEDPEVDSVTFTADNVGDWADDIKVEVELGDGADERVIVLTYNDIEYARSPSLTTQLEIVEWADTVDHVTAEVEASDEMPAVAAAAALAGGDDDRLNVTDAIRLVALNVFNRELGPGQVSYPGGVTTTIRQHVRNHGKINNRTPVLDGDNTGDDGDLIEDAVALRPTIDHSERHSGMFAPWLIVPGISPGTTRTIPPCGVVAGKMASNDGRGISPNKPSAGERGTLDWVLDLTQHFPDLSDEQLTAVNDAGVNLIRNIYGSIRIYGYRTLADPEDDANWITLSNSRLYMAIQAKADAVLERYAFEEIDPRGHTFARLEKDLVGEVLMAYWEAGSLYGATPEEAFVVDVGPTVNTPETIADLQINAKLGVKMSPFGEMVNLYISKLRLEEAIA